MMAGKLLSRVDRERTIEMLFIQNYHLKKPDEMTAAQVAKGLMLEPSQFVRNLLAGMVAQGVLSMRSVSDERLKNLKGGHTDKYWYKLSEKSIQRIEADLREIPIKSKARIVGQLSLW